MTIIVRGNISALFFVSQSVQCINKQTNEQKKVKCCDKKIKITAKETENKSFMLWNHLRIHHHLLVDGVPFVDRDHRCSL